MSSYIGSVVLLALLYFIPRSAHVSMIFVHRYSSLIHLELRINQFSGGRLGYGRGCMAVIFIKYQLYLIDENDSTNRFLIVPQVLLWHYTAVAWASWHLNSPTTQLLINSVFKLASKKQTNDALYHLPRVREATSDRWIPLTKGQ